MHRRRGYQTTFAKSLPAADEVPLFAEYDSLYRFLVRATAADPDDRFQSADEMAVQLEGVLREIAAAESGIPWPEVSATFTSELRSGSEDPDDWRALPAPLIAADDPAAAFLASLAVAVTEPDEILDLLELAPERTVEVQLREARTLIEAGRHDDADTLLNEIASPTRGSGAWRGRPDAMRSRRPTPTAPWPSSAACTRRCRASWRRSSRWPTPRRAAATWRTPRTGTTSSLAPIRGSRPPSSGWRAVGPSSATSAGSIEAYERIPSTSSSYVDAQIHKVDTMLDAEGRALTVVDVVAAGAAVARLPLPKEQQARLTASVLGAALVLVADGAPAGNGNDTRASGGPRLPADRARRPPRARDDLPAPRAPVTLGRRAHRARGPGERAPTADRAVSEEDAPTCRACGQPATADDRFCEACGSPLTPGVVVDVPDRREFDDGIVGGVTDRGHHHRRNEDAMQVARIGERVLAIVCDGVSSSAAAADASGVAAAAGAAMLRDALDDDEVDRVPRDAGGGHGRPRRGGTGSVDPHPPQQRARVHVPGGHLGRPRHHRRGGGGLPRLLGRHRHGRAAHHRRLVGAGAGRRRPVEPGGSGAPPLRGRDHPLVG